MVTFNKPKAYKVIYENLVTHEINYMVVEASNTFEAAEFVSDQLGTEYEVIKCQSAKPSELN